MRIGITGHINLSQSSVPLVYAALLAALAGIPSVRGVTCLASGADQIFARAVRVARGTYEVVLPGFDYLHRRDARRTFRLLRRASAVRCVRNAKMGEPAYVAASRELLRRCDLLLAVWDGSGGGPGGTAETVRRAKELGIPVRVIWPEGAQRTPPEGSPVQYGK